MMLFKLKRWYYQAFAAVFFNLPFLSFYLKYIPVPVLNCYACPLAAGACPIGSLQYFVIGGQFPYLVLGAVVLYGLLLGSTYCGYLCPFGFFQDLLFKLNKAEFKLPKWISFLKYFSLTVLAIILPIALASPFFCEICPAGSLEASIPIVGKEVILKLSGNLPFGISPILEMVGWLFFIKLMILLAFILLSVFSKRPFCKICPLGALFSLFNKIALFNRQSVTAAPCNSCNICRVKCPSGIDPLTELNSGDCIKCNECKAGCGVIR